MHFPKRELADTGRVSAGKIRSGLGGPEKTCFGAQSLPLIPIKLVSTGQQNNCPLGECAIRNDPMQLMGFNTGLLGPWYGSCSCFQ